MMMEIKKKASREYEELMKNKVIMQREMKHKGVPRNNSEERRGIKEEMLNEAQEINQAKMTLKVKETIIEEDTHTIMDMLGQIQKERAELELRKSIASFDELENL
mmetsp:Transcript_31951/g.31652  ORF Transcript_31951/g.31652 Transcript_31951/m.31652 type:complete len:105 (-) Transcript_31951:27-341(-)|eukprot:CAMPEP_0202949656 /NCGR_PEP_ID=MMETSP1395-20130829/16498_1 /ASSEMBLY_ACC=CAM_ASM_000871 /TAXON_ID=5961 /ORGANISM="Blepharisma japonicum, Strain Stock R1072" /LENGTH=104 /DNA_ID=CAMNT_0049652879 /DNA_START=612 /DNA_END=926 /DNA_ORIENTATION=-